MGNLSNETVRDINERINELGILVYNMFIDKKPVPVELSRHCEMSRNMIASGGNIEDAIQSIGFYTYNLFMDNKINIQEAGRLCMEISELSTKLLRPNMSYAENDNDVDRTMAMAADEVNTSYQNKPFADTATMGMPFTNTRSANTAFSNASFTDTADGAVQYPETSDGNNDLMINYPYGMEPIPTEYKRCGCGYRNKGYANFCGKCGAPLK